MFHEPEFVVPHMNQNNTHNHSMTARPTRHNPYRPTSQAAPAPAADIVATADFQQDRSQYSSPHPRETGTVRIFLGQLPYVQVHWIAYCIAKRYQPASSGCVHAIVSRAGFDAMVAVIPEQAHLHAYRIVAHTGAGLLHTLTPSLPRSLAVVTQIDFFYTDCLPLRQLRILCRLSSLDFVYVSRTRVRGEYYSRIMKSNQNNTHNHPRAPRATIHTVRSQAAPHRRNRRFPAGPLAVRGATWDSTRTRRKPSFRPLSQGNRDRPHLPGPTALRRHVQVHWIAYRFAGGTLLHNVSCIAKRYQPASSGCVQSCHAMVAVIHKRLLFDDTGVWFAGSPEEQAHLHAYPSDMWCAPPPQPAAQPCRCAGSRRPRGAGLLHTLRRCATQIVFLCASLRILCRLSSLDFVYVSRTRVRGEYYSRIMKS
jgi:hypothetical protein